MNGTGIALAVCGIIALYATFRVMLEKDTMKEAAVPDVISFAISGSIVLLVPHPLAIVAAAAYFVGSTLESNAIASTFAGGIRNG